MSECAQTAMLSDSNKAVWTGFQHPNLTAPWNASFLSEDLSEDLSDSGKSTARDSDCDPRSVESGSPSSQLVFRLGVLAWACLLFLLLCASCPKLRGFIASPDEPPPLFITMVLNETGIGSCPLRFSLGMRLPCLTGDGLMMTAKQSLGPLACRDAGFEKSGGHDNCQSNKFVLTANRTGVVIPETAVYGIHSQISFADNVAFFVQATVRVFPGNRASQSHNVTKADFDWLTCASHHEAQFNDSSSMTHCTIDGVRRLNRGDIISFVVNQPYRSMHTHGGVTHFYIYRLVT